MKKILISFMAVLLLNSCKNYKPQLCSGKWVLVNEWTLDKKENYKPSQQKTLIEFNQGGNFNYHDNKKEVGINNTYLLDGSNLKLHFVGPSNKVDANYKITRIDSSFLLINSSPDFKNVTEVTNYVFVKENSTMSQLHESTDINY